MGTHPLHLHGEHFITLTACSTIFEWWREFCHLTLPHSEIIKCSGYGQYLHIFQNVTNMFYIWKLMRFCTYIHTLIFNNQHLTNRVPPMLLIFKHSHYHLQCYCIMRNFIFLLIFFFFFFLQLSWSGRLGDYITWTRGISVSSIPAVHGNCPLM